MNTTSGRQGSGVHAPSGAYAQVRLAVAVRSAAEYLEGLKDERRVCCRSEPVADLTTQPELGAAPVNGAIDFTGAAAAAHRDLAVHQEPNGGECSACHCVPRSPGDLAVRSALIEQATAAGGTPVTTCITFYLTRGALRDVFNPRLQCW